jgi:hypothetical protein
MEAIIDYETIYRGTISLCKDAGENWADDKFWIVGLPEKYSINISSDEVFSNEHQEWMLTYYIKFDMLSRTGWHILDRQKLHCEYDLIEWFLEMVESRFVGEKLRK